MTPRLAITMGDAAGVGPEICLRLLNEPALHVTALPVVFGDARTLRRAAEATQQPFTTRVLPVAQWKEAAAVTAQPLVVDFAVPGLAGVQPGVISAETGDAAFRFFIAAIDEALTGRVEGIVTAPLSKEALHMAGHRFPGHTEILATRTSAPRSCMMQYSDEITCTFVTVHVGYAEVPALLSVERILEVIELTNDALRRLRGRVPRLAVLGLNPHAGEHGLFGEREEERIITPAIERAKERGLLVEGPLPPDTAFLPWKRRSTDAFVCLYHDQGHIPVKALAFDSAVNTTLGLPIVRTSVDHGTALDIAWQGKADCGSLFAAVRLAAQLAPDRGSRA